MVSHSSPLTSEYGDYYNPDTQLLSTLQSSITRSLTSNRPLLTHLNADTTWLLSLPYPPNSPNPSRRTFFHILLDPWLAGSQSDVARFFSQQWHATPSSVQSISEVEALIRSLEGAAVGDFDQEISHDPSQEQNEGERWIGAVVISHEFTDHMHKETLLEVDPSVPVFATSKAAGIIKSWAHFANVLDVQRFEGDWTENKHAWLPDWCGVSRVAYKGPDLLYYHSAIMITFQTSLERRGLEGVQHNGATGLEAEAEAGSNTTSGEAEAVIYTPHGIDPDNLEALVTARPRIRVLALLHGLQDIQIRSAWASSVKAQLNKGAHNGLKVQRMVKAKYWIGTHDEVKKGGGIVSWFLDRKVVSVQDAIQEEKRGIESEEGKEMELGDVKFVELGNGESLLLE